MDHSRIQELFEEKIDSSIRINQISPLSSGSINQAYRVSGADNQFFLKYNSDQREMFDEEAMGLKLLSSQQTVNIPKVFAHGTFKDIGFIILEYIQPAPSTPESQRKLQKRVHG